MVAAAASGNWGLRSSTLASQLGYIDADTTKGDFRVLWLGDPEALPVDCWRIAPGLAFGTSRNGPGTLADQWVPNRPGPSTRAWRRAVKIALNGRTTRLGHLLGPMGVRYVVVPRRVGPAAAGRPLLPPSRDVAGALAEQTDFRQLDATNDVAVFENASWVPIRAASERGAGPGGRPGRRRIRALRRRIRSAARNRRSPNATPTSPSAGTLRRARRYFAETPSSRWTLKVDGHTAVRGDGYGFGSVYTRGSHGGRVPDVSHVHRSAGCPWCSNSAVWVAGHTRGHHVPAVARPEANSRDRTPRRPTPAGAASSLVVVLLIVLARRRPSGRART